MLPHSDLRHIYIDVKLLKIQIIIVQNSGHTTYQILKIWKNIKNEGSNKNQMCFAKPYFVMFYHLETKPGYI